MGELRWYSCPSGYTRFPLPDPKEQILFVAAADVLGHLETPEDVETLRNVLANLLVSREPVPDVIPDEYEYDRLVLGRCPHGVDLDREFCPHGCRA